VQVIDIGRVLKLFMVKRTLTIYPLLVAWGMHLCKGLLFAQPFSSINSASMSLQLFLETSKTNTLAFRCKLIVASLFVALSDTLYSILCPKVQQIWQAGTKLLQRKKTKKQREKMAPLLLGRVMNKWSLFCRSQCCVIVWLLCDFWHKLGIDYFARFVYDDNRTSKYSCKWSIGKLYSVSFRKSTVSKF